MEIKSSYSNPYYNSDSKSNVITLKGISIDDNVKDFYTLVLEDISKFLSKPKNVKVEIDLTYFNTRTSKYLLQIFNLCKDLLKASEYKVTVDWYYDEDDSDMCEAAQDYESLTGISFTTIPKQPTGIASNKPF